MDPILFLMLAGVVAGACWAWSEFCDRVVNPWIRRKWGPKG